jgi:hypothetical protein
VHLGAREGALLQRADRIHCWLWSLQRTAAELSGILHSSAEPTGKWLQTSMDLQLQSWTHGHRLAQWHQYSTRLLVLLVVLALARTCGSSSTTSQY